MAIWSTCAICGRDIPFGEVCYGLFVRTEEIDGDTICKYCIAPENFPEKKMDKMERSEIISRAEKELATAMRNLERAHQRGAPEQDVRNLEDKVIYRYFVVALLKEAIKGD